MTQFLVGIAYCVWYISSMANDITTSVTADVSFRPSDGETLEAYTSCLAQALHSMATSDEVKAILSEGNPVTISIAGMPEEAKQEKMEDVPSFDIAEFLDSKISEFVEANTASITRLGEREFKNIIYSFFEDLTDTPLRKRAAAAPTGPSELAKRFLSALQ